MALIPQMMELDTLFSDELYMAHRNYNMGYGAIAQGAINNLLALILGSFQRILRYSLVNTR